MKPTELFAAPKEEEPLAASINTTPLVDIMLVLLIIFLITVPVVVQTVPVALPHERNQPSRTQPETIVIAIDRNGDLWWHATRLADEAALLDRLKAKSGAEPQPEVQIRADREVRYGLVGRAVRACQRAGIRRIAFITEPEPGQP